MDVRERKVMSSGRGPAAEIAAEIGAETGAETAAEAAAETAAETVAEATLGINDPDPGRRTRAVIAPGGTTTEVPGQEQRLQVLRKEKPFRSKIPKETQ